VPIFLEKFILPVLVGAVILIALSNPMRFDPTQRVTGAGAIILAAFFVSHSIHKKADQLKLVEPNKTDAQQESSAPKLSPPPAQQNSRGSNSPNTNITGNNNSVTNNITVNPSVAKTPPPKLTFKDLTDVVSFSLGEGGATFSTSIERLRKMPWAPFVVGANSPNFSIFAEGNTLFVTASVGGGPFGTTIEVRNNTFAVRDPSFETNSSDHALEVINAAHQPIFQLIEKNPAHIIINGYFPVPNSAPILAGPDGLTTGASERQAAEFHLKPIFKYPAWKYPGQYAE
jgi:hypothetical protein